MISGINYINLKERFIHMFTPEVVQVKPKILTKPIACEVVNGLLDKEIVADRSLSAGKSDMLKAKSRGKRTIEKYGLK